MSLHIAWRQVHSSNAPACLQPYASACPKRYTVATLQGRLLKVMCTHYNHDSSLCCRELKALMNGISINFIFDPNDSIFSLDKLNRGMCQIYMMTHQQIFFSVGGIYARSESLKTHLIFLLWLVLVVLQGNYSKGKWLPTLGSGNVISYVQPFGRILSRLPLICFDGSIYCKKFRYSQVFISS